MSKFRSGFTLNEKGKNKKKPRTETLIMISLLIKSKWQSQIIRLINKLHYSYSKKYYVCCNIIQRVKVMKNYIEHKERVKYIEGLLNKSCDWQWYIDYIEKEFEIDFSMASYADFNSVFIKIREVFDSLNKINEIVEGDFIITKKWLDKINQLSLYYLGLKDSEQIIIDNDFEKTFFLLIYLAKIANKIIDSEFRYLIYTDIIELNNIYKIIDVLPFEKESEYILSLFDKITYNTDKEKEIFNNNINKKNCDCSGYIKNNKDKLLNANCFSFGNIEKHKYDTWEEQYLSHMTSCEYKNNSLLPIYTGTDGSSFPNFNLWTEEILSIMREGFNDKAANFIIESIEYALYDKVPSNKTIQLHFELLLKYYSELNNEEGVTSNKYYCSSLEFILSFFNNKIVKLPSSCLKLFNEVLKEIKNIHVLVYIDSKCVINDKKIKESIKKFINEKLKNVELISNTKEFLISIQDADIIAGSDKTTFQCLSDKFEMCIETSSGVEISNVFLEYLLFLIKIKNNRKIVAKDISSEIVYIRKLWQEIYYNKCQGSMHCFSSEVTIPNEDINEFNENVFKKPLRIAYTCMELKEEDLVKTMQHFSEMPMFIMANSIDISEDFPKRYSYSFDDRHPIDLRFFKFAKKVRDNNVYKFLNAFEAKELVPQVYRYMNQKILLTFSLFNRTEELYNAVVKQNPEYDFLDYTEKPLLAHLTQFFPVVENKIREYGEMIGISAICETESKYYKLKEPSSVLNKIIDEIYHQTDSLDYCADFFFIHYCLFGENGLNIRNECLHGVRYIKDKSSIMFALKITLFCLYLLDFRVNLKYAKEKEEKP